MDLEFKLGTTSPEGYLYLADIATFPGIERPVMIRGMITGLDQEEILEKVFCWFRWKVEQLQASRTIYATPIFRWWQLKELINQPIDITGTEDIRVVLLGVVPLVGMPPFFVGNKKGSRGGAIHIIFIGFSRHYFFAGFGRQPAAFS